MMKPPLRGNSVRFVVTFVKPSKAAVVSSYHQGTKRTEYISYHRKLALRLPQTNRGEAGKRSGNVHSQAQQRRKKRVQKAGSSWVNSAQGLVKVAVERDACFIVLMHWRNPGVKKFFLKLCMPNTSEGSDYSNLFLVDRSRNCSR